jgi:hypothetical protein
MKRIDWQAYLDGSIEPGERREAERLLREDPQAQRELDGLKSFVSAVRQAGLSEAPQAGGRRGRAALKVGAGLLATAAVLILAFFLTLDPMRLNRAPTRETFAIESPTEAASWVVEKTGMPAPELPLGEARLIGARYGRGWACYDYQLEGNDYFLYMSRDATPLQKAERVVERDGMRYYLGQGVGWEHGELAFYLRGGEEERRLDLAILARDLL